MNSTLKGGRNRNEMCVTIKVIIAKINSVLIISILIAMLLNAIAGIRYKMRNNLQFFFLFLCIINKKNALKLN